MKPDSADATRGLTQQQLARVVLTRDLSQSGDLDPAFLEVHMDQVRYMRLFADTQGASHIERDAAVGLDQTNFVPPAPPIGVSALQPASGCAFLSVPAGYFGEWHPSPKRQWLVFISGKMEFETSDGQRFLAGQGSVVLLEDTSGPGHRSRVAADEPAVMLAVQL